MWRAAAGRRARAALAALAFAACAACAAAKDIVIGGNAGWTNTRARVRMRGAAACAAARASPPPWLPRSPCTCEADASPAYQLLGLRCAHRPAETYPPIGADVGDRLIFRWARGEHAVVQLPDETSFNECDRRLYNEVASVSDTPFTFVVPAPGVYYFACPVDAHCAGGMKVKVVANAP